MPELILSNISKRYESVTALDEIDMKISDGEFCVIIGPSGSGKTTLLNTIAGFIEPDSGTVFIDKENFNLLQPRDRNIGMVFQDIGLFSHMTVRKNLSFCLEIKKIPKNEIKEKVAEIAERLKIFDLLDKKPRHISGGEAQRVGIGRAIISEPSFFLFDEPLGNLDADLKLEMLAEIKQLHQNLRKTFLYVTHDQEQALSIADRVILMKDGKIIQEGHPLEIYNDPKTLFVAEFFGIQPINIIDGKIERNAGRLVFEGSGLNINLDNLSLQEGSEVVLGIRPADISIGNNPDSDGTGIVTLIEVLGDTYNVYLTLEKGQKIVAICSAEMNLTENDQVDLKLNKESIYIFDKTSGRRIYFGR